MDKQITFDQLENGVIVDSDPDMVNYRWRDIFPKVKELGRPLTEEEFQAYRMPDGECENLKIQRVTSPNAFSGAPKIAAR